MENEKTNKLSVPLAIVFSGILIAGAVIYTKTPIAGSPQTADSDQRGKTQNSLDNMRPVSKEDHIRGNQKAEVVIVEYSDTECPFCKMFHSTMKQVVSEYGDKVAWVYRHFPLDQLHPKARKEAEALECAAELGGNDKFWAYTDRLYEITPANNGLDPLELPKIASYVGLDADEFSKCLSSGKYASKVEEDVQNAFMTGGGGTPWSIVATKSGKKYELSGAQPIDSIRQIIEQAMK